MSTTIAAQQAEISALRVRMDELGTANSPIAIGVNASEKRPSAVSSVSKLLQNLFPRCFPLLFLLAPVFAEGVDVPVMDAVF